MSHPTNPPFAQFVSSSHTVEYDPKEFAKLKRRNLRLQFTAIVSLMAWMALFLTGFELVRMIACVAMLIPLVYLGSHAGEVRNEYLKMKQKKELIEEAFRVARGFINPEIHLSSDALFRVHVEVESPDEDLSPVTLTIVPFNIETNLPDTRRETLEYYVSLTKVETLQGPKISTILKDLRDVLIQDKRFHEANERMKAHFPAKWNFDAVVPHHMRSFHAPGIRRDE